MIPASAFTVRFYSMVLHGNPPICNQNIMLLFHYSTEKTIRQGIMPLCLFRFALLNDT